MKFIKPEILISKCLEFDACRYDGQIINNKYIKKLKKFIDFIPVCPEVEIGMGIPRAPIHIISQDHKKILHQTETGKDFSPKMNSFSEKYLSKINQIDGFILKSKSPSCGIRDTKIYSNKTPSPIGKGEGLFTSKIIEKFPYHPKEDEKRLNNPLLREHFFTAIFTIADFKTVNNMENLYNYHAKHKYLFMSYNQTLMRKMGQVAANKKKEDFKILSKKYQDLLLILLSKRARYTSNINTQMHVMGYFKNLISSKEKNYFLNLLDQYRERRKPLSTVNQILLSWIIRFKDEYLSKQSFFTPFHKDLIERETSRFE